MRSYKKNQGGGDTGLVSVSSVTSVLREHPC